MTKARRIDRDRSPFIMVASDRSGFLRRRMILTRGGQTRLLTFDALCCLMSTDGGKCAVTQEVLAKYVGVSDDTVRSALKWLVDNCFIGVAEKRVAGAFVYHLDPSMVMHGKRPAKSYAFVLTPPGSTPVSRGEVPAEPPVNRGVGRPKSTGPVSPSGMRSRKHRAKLADEKRAAAKSAIVLVVDNEQTELKEAVS